MKTKLFSLMFLLVFATSVFAQSKDEKSFKFGAGAMIALPMGDMTDLASLSYGIDVIGEYPVASALSITLSAGYVDWAKKTSQSEALPTVTLKSPLKSATIGAAATNPNDLVSGDSNLSLIPILAGVKYHFTDKIYGSAQAGLSFATASGVGSIFTFAPGIGYKISEKIDLLLKYQSASKDGANMSFLGLRAGLSF